MALPLPSLTFAHGAPVVAASTSKVDVLAAITAAIAALPDNVWQVSAAQSADTTNLPGLLIQPPVGSPTEGKSLLLGFGNAAGTPAAGQILSPDAVTSNIGWLAFSPDDFDAGNNWYDASPFGAGNRNSKLWACLPATSVTQVWASASQETLLLGFRHGSDTQCSYLYAGAIVEPFSTDYAEPDDRLYGMAVMGTANTLLTTWTANATGSSTSFLSWNALGTAAGGYPHTGLWLPPTGSVWVLTRPEYLLTSTAAQTPPLGAALTPLYAFGTNGTAFTNAFGRFRGLYTYQDSLARVILLDGLGNEIGRTIASEIAGTVRPAFVVANEP